jgi:hypothetical protein
MPEGLPPGGHDARDFVVWAVLLLFACRWLHDAIKYHQ